MRADPFDGDRLGDQDLESIVELLRRQNCSQEAWLEAVGEQEDKLRGMEEELARLKRQKLAMAGEIRFVSHNFRGKNV